jgi:hypothetical protein
VFNSISVFSQNVEPLAMIGKENLKAGKEYTITSPVFKEWLFGLE